MLRRKIAAELERWLKSAEQKALFITGSRQIGKKLFDSRIWQSQPCNLHRAQSHGKSPGKRCSSRGAECR